MSTIGRYRAVYRRYQSVQAFVTTTALFLVLLLIAQWQFKDWILVIPLIGAATASGVAKDTLRLPWRTSAKYILAVCVAAALIFMAAGYLAGGLGDETVWDVVGSTPIVVAGLFAFASMVRFFS